MARVFVSFLVVVVEDLREEGLFWRPKSPSRQHEHGGRSRDKMVYTVSARAQEARRRPYWSSAHFPYFILNTS